MRQYLPSELGPVLRGVVCHRETAVYMVSRCRWPSWWCFGFGRGLAALGKVVVYIGPLDGLAATRKLGCWVLGAGAATAWREFWKRVHDIIFGFGVCLN